MWDGISRQKWVTKKGIWEWQNAGTELFHVLKICAYLCEVEFIDGVQNPLRVCPIHCDQCIELVNRHRGWLVALIVVNRIWSLTQNMINNGVNKYLSQDQWGTQINNFLLRKSSSWPHLVVGEVSAWWKVWQLLNNGITSHRRRSGGRGNISPTVIQESLVLGIPLTTKNCMRQKFFSKEIQWDFWTYFR